MANTVSTNYRILTASEFFARARERLTFDVPAGFADPQVIPPHDQPDADPALIAAIAAVRPIRPAAVLVPVIEREEPSVLFTQRTSHLRDHSGQISFPGGKIDTDDASPAAAALREAEEEVALARSFVEPIGYLDIHMNPFGFRIMPVLARVRPGFLTSAKHRRSRGRLRSASVVPDDAATLPARGPRLERASFGDRSIWGATAGILRNLYERVYRESRSLEPQAQ
jgi:8-oxo-dGTP pyrophosphatase MutT (NUDIX family)